MRQLEWPYHTQHHDKQWCMGSFTLPTPGVNILQLLLVMMQNLKIPPMPVGPQTSAIYQAWDMHLQTFINKRC